MTRHEHELRLHTQGSKLDGFAARLLDIRRQTQHPPVGQAVLEFQLVTLAQRIAVIAILSWRQAPVMGAPILSLEGPFLGIHFRDLELGISRRRAKQETCRDSTPSSPKNRRPVAQRALGNSRKQGNSGRKQAPPPSTSPRGLPAFSSISPKPRTNCNAGHGYVASNAGRRCRISRRRALPRRTGASPVQVQDAKKRRNGKRCGNARHAAENTV